MKVTVIYDEEVKQRLTEMRAVLVRYDSRVRADTTDRSSNAYRERRKITNAISAVQALASPIRIELEDEE